MLFFFNCAAPAAPCCGPAVAAEPPRPAHAACGAAGARGGCQGRSDNRGWALESLKSLAAVAVWLRFGVFCVSIKCLLCVDLVSFVCVDLVSFVCVDLVSFVCRFSVFCVSI
jgi:hypothetical protein